MTVLDPFREVERLLGSALRQSPSAALMPLDLYRSGEEFVVKIDLPGVDPGSIDIDVASGHANLPVGGHGLPC